MSSTESALFPCPRCGVGRGEGGVSCKQCGWDPETVHAPIKPKPEPISKFKAMLLGFFTLLPVAYIIFFIAVIMMSLFRVGERGQVSFIPLFIMHMAVTISSWVLLGYYLYFLFKTDRVKKDQKALWAVVLFLGNILAMPVFWYLYVLKPAEDASSIRT